MWVRYRQTDNPNKIQERSSIDNLIPPPPEMRNPTDLTLFTDDAYIRCGHENRYAKLRKCALFDTVGYEAVKLETCHPSLFLENVPPLHCDPRPDST